MLIDDDLVTLWIPEEFIDESSYGFRLDNDEKLRIGRYPLQEGADLRALVQERWREAKRMIANLDAHAVVSESVEDTTVADAPTALGFITIQGREFALYKGLALARLGHDADVEIEFDVSSATPLDSQRLENEFRAILSRIWRLSSPTMPVVPAGSSTRLIGHLGLVLSNGARAHSDYRYRSPQTDLRLAIVTNTTTARRYPTNYFDDGDRLTVTRSETRDLFAQGSAMKRTETVEVIHRERAPIQIGDAIYAAGLSDAHHARIAELRNDAPDDGDGRRLIVSAVAPAAAETELDAVWARVLATCRLSEHGATHP